MRVPYVERAVAAVALVALSPLMLAAALAVRLDSRGPALHRATRIGWNGRSFVLFKFRSMAIGHPEGARITATGDPRVTRVGRVLRSTKIDELPQLVNVLRGEMRFVGPRPEDPAYVDADDPLQEELMRHVPGVTGPASVAFRHEEQMLADMVAAGEEPDEAYARVAATKRRIDLEYLRRRGFASDVKMIFSTVRSVFRPPASPVLMDDGTSTVTRDEFATLEKTYRDYRGRYASRWSADRPGNRAIVCERERVALGLLRGRADRAVVILDLGAGAGGSFPGLFPGVRRIRLDILEWRLREVSETEDSADSVCGDGAALPFRADSIDVVLLSTVLSSVTQRVGRAMLGEIERVIRPGGVAVVYDFRVPNPRNAATHAVSRRWIEESLPCFDVEARSVTLVPQVARLLGPMVPLLYSPLSRIPVLRTHNLVVGQRCGDVEAAPDLT